MCRWIDAIISDRLLFSNSNPEKKMCCRISFGKQALKMNRRLHLPVKVMLHNQCILAMINSGPILGALLNTLKQNSGQPNRPWNA